jgi:hypothetical protein
MIPKMPRWVVLLDAILRESTVTLEAFLGC